jgi:hypothetical protein
MEGFFEGFAQAAERPWAGAVLLVLVAPITEELLFRGIILAGLLARYRAPAAILISTLLFMLVHLNPWQFAGAGGLGLMAGWLYARTRSVVPCILVHMVQNGMVCLVPWLPIHIEGFTDADFFAPPSHQPVWFNALGLALLAAGLATAWRVCPIHPPAITPEEIAPSNPPSPPDPSGPPSPPPQAPPVLHG